MQALRCCQSYRTWHNGVTNGELGSVLPVSTAYASNGPRALLYALGVAVRSDAWLKNRI